jgi:hypothetical protein
VLNDVNKLIRRIVSNEPGEAIYRPFIDMLLAQDIRNDVISVISGLHAPTSAYLLANIIKSGSYKEVIVDFFYHLRVRKVELPLGHLLTYHDVGSWLTKLSREDLIMIIGPSEMKKLAFRVTYGDNVACDVLLKLADTRVINMIVEGWCRADNPLDGCTLNFLAKLTNVFDYSAVEELTQILIGDGESFDDKTTFIRSIAARSLGNIGSERAVEALVVMLAEEIRMIQETNEETHWKVFNARDAALKIIRTVATTLIKLSVTTKDLTTLKPLLLVVSSGDYPSEIVTTSQKLLQIIDSS